MITDVLIIGGGAIGLSLAYALAEHGVSVRVIERGLPGQESSWAGAGIIPAVASPPGSHPYQQLGALSQSLHGEWGLKLREETGIDNGYRRCGGLYVARDPQSTRELESAVRNWRQDGLQVETLPSALLAERQPLLSPTMSAYLVRDEAQLRNPRHLKALLVACQRRGVVISSGVEAGDFTVQGNRVTAVETTEGPIAVGQVCICGGAWSRLIASHLGVSLAVKPIRGQIVLLDRGALSIPHIINDGPRYFVPRDDGRLLVGSTEEDVGFEKRNTTDGIRELVEFAIAVMPALSEARFERCWAGLRPGSADGLPYLGRLLDYDNTWIAAGHFRAGLSLSCATAVVMSQAIRGEQPQIDLTPFSVDRSIAGVGNR